METTEPIDPEDFESAQFLDTIVTVTRSAGSDGAVVVFIDTKYEPDASDGGPGLRVIVNDADVYAGVAYVPELDN